MPSNEEKLDDLFKVESGMSAKSLDFITSLDNQRDDGVGSIHVTERQQEWLDDLWKRYCNNGQ